MKYLNAALSPFFGIALILSVTTACSGEGESGTPLSDASLTGSPNSDAGETLPLIVIGTGEIGFEPITENQTLPLILGPQGTGRIEGYHLWGAVRTRGLDNSERITLNFDLTRVSDELVVAQSQWEKKLQPTVDGDEFYALPVIVSDCCDVRGQMLQLSVTATDKKAQTVTDTIQIRAGDRCGDVDGREICP